jgi:hypothetical protein
MGADISAATLSRRACGDTAGIVRHRTVPSTRPHRLHTSPRSSTAKSRVLGRSPSTQEDYGVRNIPLSQLVNLEFILFTNCDFHVTYDSPQLITHVHKPSYTPSVSDYLRSQTRLCINILAHPIKGGTSHCKCGLDTTFLHLHLSTPHTFTDSLTLTI